MFQLCSHHYLYQARLSPCNPGATTGNSRGTRKAVEMEPESSHYDSQIEQPNHHVGSIYLVCACCIPETPFPRESRYTSCTAARRSRHFEHASGPTESEQELE